jgi:hypothetical protein
MRMEFDSFFGSTLINTLIIVVLLMFLGSWF